MKKYLMLFGDVVLLGVFLFSAFSREWTLPLASPLDITHPTPAGSYIALSSSHAPLTITITGHSTHTLSHPGNHHAVFFSLTETSSLVSSGEVRVYPQKGVLFHSLFIAAMILFVILGISWVKRSRGESWQRRFLLLALGFGWSGSLSVLFLALSVVSGLPRAWKEYSFSRHHGLLVGFILWCLFSGVLARFPLSGIGSTGLVVLYALIALAFSHERWTTSYWTRVGEAIVSSVLTVAFIGLVQQYVIREDIGIRVGESWIVFWPYHPHELASLFEWTARGGYWLGIMLPILFWIATRTSEKKHKLLFWIGLFMGVGLLLLTQSRGGFVITFVGVFSQLLFKKRGYLAWLLLLLPLGMVLIAPQSKWAQSLKNPLTYHTNVQRLHQIQAARDFWREANKLTGIGLMNYREYYYEKRHQYDIYSVADYLHQGYFALLLETGMVGFVLFFGFFLALWVASFRRAIMLTSSEYPLLWGTFNAFAVSLLFDAMLLYAFYLGMWLWILIGLGETRVEPALQHTKT